MTKNERPILFSAPMVRAILAGKKTQTRRVVKPQPAWVYADRVPVKTQDAAPSGGIKCPYGQPGDMLWVRETFSKNGVLPLADRPPGEYIYAADLIFSATWKPSIHMPRRASRITLEITDIFVERVQDISEDDAKAEGVSIGFGWDDEEKTKCTINYRDPFSRLWDSINAKRGFGWSVNPWVWVICFRPIHLGPVHD